MSETMQRCREHITALCAEHAIVRLATGGTNGWAYRHKGGARGIRIPPVTTELRYAIALHELGHHLGPRQEQGRLFGEWGAWDWALHASLIDFTPRTYQAIVARVCHYTIRGLWEEAAWVPGLNDDFWPWLRSIALVSGFHQATFDPAVLLAHHWWRGPRNAAMLARRTRVLRGWLARLPE